LAVRDIGAATQMQHDGKNAIRISGFFGYFDSDIRRFDPSRPNQRRLEQFTTSDIRTEENL
jgi:hypothetical protein